MECTGRMKEHTVGNSIDDGKKTQVVDGKDQAKRVVSVKRKKWLVIISRYVCCIDSIVGFAAVGGE